MRGHKRITCTCSYSKCGKQFTLNTSEHRRRMKNNSVGVFCSEACYHAYVQERKTNLSTKVAIAKAIKKKRTLMHEIDNRNKRITEIDLEIARLATELNGKITALPPLPKE